MVSTFNGVVWFKASTSSVIRTPNTLLKGKKLAKRMWKIGLSMHTLVKIGFVQSLQKLMPLTTQKTLVEKESFPSRRFGGIGNSSSNYYQFVIKNSRGRSPFSLVRVAINSINF
ncbi:hypothetical protein M758_5G099000 [Ceratodon purpureus]|nr:hypothetical protein M758_5G099000 [Ceratodon purpureus]